MISPRGNLPARTWTGPRAARAWSADAVAAQTPPDERGPGRCRPACGWRRPAIREQGHDHALRPHHRPETGWRLDPGAEPRLGHAGKLQRRPGDLRQRG